MRFLEFLLVLMPWFFLIGCRGKTISIKRPSPAVAISPAPSLPPPDLTRGSDVPVGSPSPSPDPPPGNSGPPPVSTSGRLDTSFGDSGVSFAFTTNASRANALVVQSDGKIIAAGYGLGTTNYTFAVARFHENGSLDSTFGSSGQVTTPISANNNIANALATQSDGKIILVGRNHNGTSHDFALARFRSTGILDTTFSIDGKAVTVLGDQGSIAYAVAIQSDGKIIAAGESASSTRPTGIDLALVRYNSDGSIDTSFGVAGKVITDLGTALDRAFDIALQPDGKILIAAQRNSLGLALARYNENGSLDGAFGNAGVATTVISPLNYANSVALQSDGKILLGGWIADEESENRRIALVRHNSDGSLDSSFGVAGVATVGNVDGDRGRAVRLQNDGKIVVAGNAVNSAGKTFVVLYRFHSNGTLDTSFGTEGRVATSVGDTSSLSALAIQGDGKPIVCGAGMRAGATVGNFTLIRYLR